MKALKRVCALWCLAAFCLVFTTIAFAEDSMETRAGIRFLPETETSQPAPTPSTPSYPKTPPRNNPPPPPSRTTPSRSNPSPAQTSWDPAETVSIMDPQVPLASLGQLPKTGGGSRIPLYLILTGMAVLLYARREYRDPV